MKGTPVQEYLRKSEKTPNDGMIDRVLVLRGFRSFEETEANWMADNLLKAIRTQQPDLQVADMPVSAFRLFGAVSNDPEQDNFNPEDQLPLFLEALERAQAIVLVTRETCGLPDSNIVRLTERLAAALQGEAQTDLTRNAFAKPKALVVIAFGSEGAYSAAGNLTSAWVRFGCSVPRRGICFWDGGRGDITKAAGLGKQILMLARGLVLALPGGERAE